MSLFLKSFCFSPEDILASRGWHVSALQCNAQFNLFIYKSCGVWKEALLHNADTSIKSGPEHCFGGGLLMSVMCKNHTSRNDERILSMTYPWLGGLYNGPDVLCVHCVLYEILKTEELLFFGSRSEWEMPGSGLSSKWVQMTAVMFGLDYLIH